MPFTTEMHAIKLIWLALSDRATHTMHHLSEGWGHGTGLATIVSWSLAISKFIKVVECV